MADQPFLASNSFNGDGSTVVWEFSFEGLATDAPLTAKPYIDSADVRAELITGVGDEQVTVPQAFLFETANSIRVEPPVPVGTILRVFRNTENRFPLVNYQDLQSVGASDLDLANRQAVYIVQEARDAARGAGNVSAETLAIAQGAAQGAQASAEAAELSAASAAASAAAAGSADGLREDLNTSGDASKAAGQVKYDTGLSYPAGSVGEALQDLQLSVPDTPTSVRAFGAVGNGVADDTVALQLAIDSTTGSLSLEDGYTYKVSRLVGRSNLRLEGNSILDFSANADYASNIADPLFKIWGTAGPVIAVTSPIAQYATIIDVASTAGITPDDLIEIATPGNDGDFVDTSVTVHNGEICQVLEVVSGTQLRLAEPVLDRNGYAPVNSAQIRKLNTVDDVVIGAGITIRGRGRPQPSGSGDNGLIVMYGRNTKIHCNFQHVDLAAVRLEGCYNYEVSGSTIIMNAQGSNTGVNYGIVPSGSSKHGRVFGNKCANMRHAVVTSHLSSALGLQLWGVVRDLNVYDNTCVNTWHAAIATHSDADTVEIYRNNLFGCQFGVNPRERNVSVHDNTMVNCNQAVYLTARPRDVSIVRNKAVGCGNFLLTSLAGTRDVTGLTIEDNEVIRCGGGISLVLFAPASAHRRVSINNNKFREVASAGGAQALIRVTAGPLVDSTISANEAQDCTGVSGISLDGGSTRLQLFGNNMWDVDGNSFVTAVTGGAYNNCFGKGNVCKTGGWSGNANMTNGATIVADNTFF